MSPEQLEKKRKIKVTKKKSLEIRKEQKTLEKTKTKKNKVDLCSKKRRKSDDKADEVDSVSDGLNLEKKKKKKTTKLGLEKKRRVEKGKEADSNNVDKLDHKNLDRGHARMEKKKKSKPGLKKKRRREKEIEVFASNEDQIHADEHADNEMMSHLGSRPKNDHAKRLSHSQTLSESGNSEKPKASSNGTKIKAKKVNKESKHKKKDSHIAKERKIEQIVGEADEVKVEEIPLVDEDCSRGMKKWLIKYKEDRPGLKVLQQRIDDFITAHEERQEQERKEREAQAAEGGWTVVTHLKGRKKTTDTETGVTIGSVAQAAVVDKMGKKKSKEVPIDFYRFKKREARRNEVMMLQSKFEQDKKRIQQLRAARKFRPY